jgi:hypothetical protein
VRAQFVEEKFVNDFHCRRALIETTGAANLHLLHHEATDPSFLGDGLNDRAFVLVISSTVIARSPQGDEAIQDFWCQFLDCFA